MAGAVRLYTIADEKQELTCRSEHTKPPVKVISVGSLALLHGLSGRRLITSYIMKVLTLLRSEVILLYTTTSFPNSTSRRIACGVTMLELSFHVMASI